MKFADGFWLNRRGYSVDYAVQPYEVQVRDHRIRVLAAAQQIRHRSMTLGGVLLEIVFSAIRRDTIRVQIMHHKGAVNRRPQHQLYPEDGFVPVITETADAVTLTAGKTAVTVSKGTDWNVLYTYDGKRLTGSGQRALSYIREGRQMTETRLRAAADSPFWSIPVNAAGNYVREQLDISVGECLYGFGERFTPFVKNGQTVDIWNADGGTCSDQSYKCIPFYLSSRGYGVFTNDTGAVSYEVASETVSRVSMTVPGESLEYFVIGGERCADVLANYTALTGRPALPPAKSLGLWLSTSFTTDYDERTVGSFLEGMKQRGIPLEMFHFDCFWMKAFTWTSFEWDEAQFPNPAGMLSGLKRDYGVGICVWINPYIAQQSPLFDAGVREGYFLHTRDGGIFQTDMWQPGMALVDFTNPAACEWFAEGIRRLCAMGVTAVKTDFGERIPTDVVWYDGSDPAAMHNYYAYLYNRTVFTALEGCVGKERAVLFARSAAAGCQQFPVHWGGDCAATYSAMAETLRGGLSLCASGFGFFSHDIGGFEQTASADVYKRWVAFGLMSTHSRLHGSMSYRVPWAYEEDDPANPENACAVLRFFTQWKGRLMPYLWTQANRTHETGIPMMRAMVLDFADDPACLTLDRQYLLGDSLLCAPVLDESGIAEFYLPAGEWYDLFSDVTAPPVTGGRWMRRRCSYLEMPVYIRQGTVMVLGDFRGNAEYDYLDRAEVRLCGIADGSTVTCDIYRASGGLDCTLTVTRQGSTVTLTYPPTPRHFTVRVAGSAVCAEADGSGTLVLTV